MAQEISSRFHHRPYKTLHFVSVVAQLSFGYGYPAKRHFELAFDIGEQAHALFFRYGVQRHRQRASIDASREQCLQADRLASHRNHHDIFVGVQSARSKHSARGTVNRTGKAADSNFLPRSRATVLNSGRPTKVRSAKLCGRCTTLIGKPCAAATMPEPPPNSV